MHSIVIQRMTHCNSFRAGSSRACSRRMADGICRSVGAVMVRTAESTGARFCDVCVACVHVCVYVCMCVADGGSGSMGTVVVRTAALVRVCVCVCVFVCALCACILSCCYVLCVCVCGQMRAALQSF